MSKNTNNKYLITRQQYKNIKKYDHNQMDKWIRSFVANIKGMENADNENIVNDMSDIYRNVISEALENTKGIGEKIRNNFTDNFNKALDEKIKDNKLFVSSKGE